jgi:hypothetical protein
MTDEAIAELEAAAGACDQAREALTDALASVDTHDGAPDDEALLRPVGEALTDWRDAQRRFMAAVEASDAPDVATAAMILKTNHGVDPTNARRGLPGVHVEGTDKPFDLDLSGTRGTALTNAALEYVE